VAHQHHTSVYVPPMRRGLIMGVGLTVAASAGALAFAASASEDVVQLKPSEAATAQQLLVAAAEEDESIIGSPNAFCQLDVAGYSQTPASGTEAHAYAVASCVELIPGRGGGLTVGEGIDTPIRFTVTGTPSGLKVVELALPGDGEGYSDAVNELFPSGPARELATGTPAFDECELLDAARQRHDLPRAQVVGDPALSEPFADCA
jgi:hypothetical protein